MIHSWLTAVDIANTTLVKSIKALSDKVAEIKTSIDFISEEDYGYSEDPMVVA